jgi:hypothetical protein
LVSSTAITGRPLIAFEYSAEAISKGLELSCTSNGYLGEALDIPRQALVKLGTQEAELCVQEVDEIIGSICKVAIRFSNIAHDLLPGQIQAETPTDPKNRIEHNIHLLH